MSRGVCAERGTRERACTDTLQFLLLHRRAERGTRDLQPHPLDGSKILGALLPERAYYTLLRYERYGMLVLVALMFLGRAFPQLDLFARILTPAREAVLDAFRWLARLPFGLN